MSKRYIALKKKRDFWKVPLKNTMVTNKNLVLNMGIIGLVVLNSFIITRMGKYCIERTLKQHLRKKLGYRLNFSLTTAYTKKSIGMRMGKGKAKKRYTIGHISKGQCIIELKIKTQEDFIKSFLVLRKISKKIKTKTKIVLLKY